MEEFEAKQHHMHTQKAKKNKQVQHITHVHKFKNNKHSRDPSLLIAGLSRAVP